MPPQPYRAVIAGAIGREVLTELIQSLLYANVTALPAGDPTRTVG